MKFITVISLVAVVLRTEAKYLRSDDSTTPAPEPRLDENIDSVVKAFPELRAFLSNYKSVQVIPKDAMRLVAPPPFMDEICYGRKPMCIPMPAQHSPLKSLFGGGYQQSHQICYEMDPHCLNPYQLISETETMLKQCSYSPNLPWCGRLLKLQDLDKAIVQEQCEETPGVPCDTDEKPTHIVDRLRQCEWDVTLPGCKALKNHLRALGAIAIDRIMQIARGDVAVKDTTTSTTSPPTIKPNRQVFYEDDKLPLWLTLGIKNRMKTSTPGY